jgi:carboxylesterase type B
LLYGGSTSTPMYDGSGFAKKGVIMVSVSCRLGTFGFLAHPERSRESGHGSGTYGIQDMIEGLKWAKENISKFGGDPSNVTIFGHSAGGDGPIGADLASVRKLYHEIIRRFEMLSCSFLIIYLDISY